MQKDDPKVEVLRIRRAKTGLYLDILSKGLGKILYEGYTRYPEEYKELLEFIENDLKPAIQMAQEAEEAYRPYWRRHRLRRVRITKLSKLKSTKKKGKVA